jgi:benzoyl-CoA 2,3-epoxidase subunit A
MTLPAGYLRQHLIDPELCARCNSCEEACTRQAILHDHRCYAVDVEKCDQRMDCIKGCSTGAIDNWRVVRVDQAYSTAQQLEWMDLPPPLPFTNGVESEAVRDALAQAGRRNHAPPSAPRAVIGTYTMQNPGIATIVENRALTVPDDGAEVRHIVLDFGQSPCTIVEGQSVGILPPGFDDLGRPHHIRLYSVASAREGEQPRNPRVAFTVKRVLADHHGNAVRGVCSNYLCNLAPGGQVSFTGPVGDTFLMPDAPLTSLLMICTGTGIAPMRGMIQRRARLPRHLGGPMALFYGGRTPAELPYHDEMQSLPSGLVELHCAYSRAPGQPKRYVQDLLREQSELVARLVLRERCYVYLCGLTAMERGVRDALADILRAAGADWNQLQPQLVSEGRYHVEVY